MQRRFVTDRSQAAYQKTCVVCQKQSPHTLLYIKWGYPIVRCKECTHVSTVVAKDSPLLTSPEEFYSSGYFEGAMKDGYQSYQKERSTLVRHFSRFLARHVLPLKSHGRLLGGPKSLRR
jgi:hypothetical protein